MATKLDGYTELIFKHRSQGTIAHTIYHTGNSRVSSAIKVKKEDIPYYFLITTGGGFVEGEHYEGDITVEANAHGIVTTQTPTYVFKCDNNQLTTQDMRLNVHAGGCLEFLSDEIIPYKNAYYKQNTTINMEENSCLIYTDGITAGWSPEDIPFEYHEVGNKTTVYQQGKLIYNDFLLVNPRQDNMASLGFFEGYTNLNSLLILDEAVNQEFINLCRAKVDELSTDCIYGISQLDVPGLVMRVLGHSAYENRKLINRVIEIFRQSKNWPVLNLRKNDK